MEPPIIETPDGEIGADLLAALRLQFDWGADEALEDEPVDRLRQPGPTPALVAAPGPPTAVRSPAFQLGASQVPASQAGAMAPTQVAQAALRASQAAAAARDLDGLRAAIAGFDGCALRDTASHLVFAEGDPACGLLLIGDAPGADEDRSGHPFAGEAGNYLDRMLASIGLSRRQALLSHLLPWRPPGDRPPSQAELQACLPFLWRLIELTGPRHIVLFSGLAARMLMPDLPRRRQPGVWATLSLPGQDGAAVGPILSLPSHSLSAVQRTAARRRDAWADLRSLRRALNPPMAT